MKLDNNTTDIYFRNNDTDRVYYGDILIWEKPSSDGSFSFPIKLTLTNDADDNTVILSIFYEIPNTTNGLTVDDIPLKECKEFYNSSTHILNGTIKYVPHYTSLNDYIPRTYAVGYWDDKIKEINSLPSDAGLPLQGYLGNYDDALEYVDMSNITKLGNVQPSNKNSLIDNCVNLKEVKFGNFDATNVESLFDYCKKLEKLSGYIYNLDYKSGAKFSDTNLKGSYLMIIINGLVTLRSSKYLWISQTQYNSLSSSDIAVATSKGWTVSVY